MSQSNRAATSRRITIVGAGIAGLTAAITCAEGGAELDRFWLSALTAYKAVVEQTEKEVS